MTGGSGAAVTIAAPADTCWMAAGEVQSQKNNCNKSGPTSKNPVPYPRRVDDNDVAFLVSPRPETPHARLKDFVNVNSKKSVVSQGY